MKLVIDYLFIFGTKNISCIMYYLINQYLWVIKCQSKGFCYVNEVIIVIPALVISIKTLSENEETLECNCYPIFLLLLIFTYHLVRRVMNKQQMFHRFRFNQNAVKISFICPFFNIHVFTYAYTVKRNETAKTTMKIK